MMFRHVNCQRVLNGNVLSWDINHDYEPFRVSVYGSKEGKEWVLLDKDNRVGRYYDECGAQTLMKLYRLEGVGEDGKVHLQDNIASSLTTGQATRLARECMRREDLLIRTHPYGRAIAKVFMRYRSGAPCECGCTSDAPNLKCPVCIGTSIIGGYYLYPTELNLLIVDPRDDKTIGNPDIRSTVAHTFRTTFPGWLREYDILLIGGELFDVLQQDVASSVADIPVAYNLSCVQIQPSEERYKILKGRI